MLHTVQLVYPSPVPMLGVNVGQLGYMSELEPDELEPWLPRLLAGDFEVRGAHDARRSTWSRRARRAALVRRSTRRCSRSCASGHLIRLDVSINGTPFTSYAADGVIVATPTGQHGVLVLGRRTDRVARAALLVLTPVSPHMLFDRSLVLVGARGDLVRGEQRTQRRTHDRRSRAGRAQLR